HGLIVLSADEADCGLTDVTKYSVTPVTVVPTASMKFVHPVPAFPLMPPVSFQATAPTTASTSVSEMLPLSAALLLPLAWLLSSTELVARMFLNSKPCTLYAHVPLGLPPIVTRMESVVSTLVPTKAWQIALLGDPAAPWKLSSVT